MTGPAKPTDLYVACFSDVHGWGGAITAARGLIATGQRRGWHSRLLGVSPHAESHAATEHGREGLNVHLMAEPLLWRCRSWRVSGQLQRQLNRLPPPRRAFVSLSPHWVVAAKRAWPAVSAVYVFPCLLSNCLPFTWPQRRPPTFWKHVDLAGIRRAEHRAFERADVILVPTAQARDEITAFHAAARERISVCTYGCDPDPIADGMRATQRQALGLGDDDVMFLAAGVCDRNKAFDWAIRELSAVDRRAKLVIVGDGPDRQWLQYLASELGQGERVHLAGAQREMAPWYAAADGVLSTSCYDTFPNVLLEAMSHGRPVVVPQHAPPDVYAGVAGLVNEHGGGRVYDRRQAGALAGVLNELTGDHCLIAELGRQAREIARRLFDWGDCIERIAVLST